MKGADHTRRAPALASKPFILEKAHSGWRVYLDERALPPEAYKLWRRRRQVKPSASVVALNATGMRPRLQGILHGVLATIPENSVIVKYRSTADEMVAVTGVLLELLPANVLGAQIDFYHSGRVVVPNVQKFTDPVTTVLQHVRNVRPGEYKPGSGAQDAPIFTSSEKRTLKDLAEGRVQISVNEHGDVLASHAVRNIKTLSRLEAIAIHRDGTWELLPFGDAVLEKLR